jgi:hypothetical protein
MASAAAAAGGNLAATAAACAGCQHGVSLAKKKNARKPDISAGSGCGNRRNKIGGDQQRGENS